MSTDPNQAAASAALEGCLINLLLDPRVWVLLEFMGVAGILASITLGLGLHPVIAIVVGLSTLLGLRAWFRSRSAGKALMWIITIFWALLGGWIGWAATPQKSRDQLEWMHRHGMIDDAAFERRREGAPSSPDRLWEVFWTGTGMTVLGGISLGIHRAARPRRAETDPMPDG